MLSLAFNILSGQVKIPYRSTVVHPQEAGLFEQSILNPNKFQMNQSFSLSTSFSNKMSQTTGIYSNFTNYNLSETMNLRTGLHLIQNQNNLAYSSGPQTSISYELGLEYKLSPNSIISLQVINNNNFPTIYQRFAPFHVP
jgi:hypothetical protein